MRYHGVLKIKDCVSPDFCELLYVNVCMRLIDGFSELKVQRYRSVVMGFMVSLTEMTQSFQSCYR